MNDGIRPSARSGPGADSEVESPTRRTPTRGEEPVACGQSQVIDEAIPSTVREQQNRKATGDAVSSS